MLFCFFLFFFSSLHFILPVIWHTEGRGGGGGAIPLHALQTTVKVLYWLIVSLAHPFHAPFMQFQNQKLFWNSLNSREGTIQ